MNFRSNVSVACTFESPDCIFKNVGGDVFDWTMFHSGSTPSSYTGPSSAAVGGMYAFIEASSPPLDRCLQFQYHMKGVPGRLDVYAYSRHNPRNLAWSRQGNQGSSWKFAQVDIPSNISDLVIDIKGVRGTSYKGDIAVDEIKLEPHACQIIIRHGKVVFSENTSFHTPDNYYYHSLSQNGATRTFLIFNVRACNDAHIGLFTTFPSMNQRQFYEIVIGGWGNTKSVIRKVKQGQPMAQKFAKFLSCTNAKPFWVSWNNGHIKVGTGKDVDRNTFMVWTDPNPYQVNFVAVTSGFGSDADWTILYNR
ncbi:hypothetical protein KUTeg_002394 [Tegillarca granosa]|uniref:MAM domain-containing protein n=1 Tax=Tegillarca granosa TaxID=220873 RepID=A0ABQ9FVI2_TEGGR|nr:hypothetical protein KUTeg_002394 [Tegillarca granosa]